MAALYVYTRYAPSCSTGSDHLVPDLLPYASDEEVAGAPFTFQDWAHGIGGFSCVGLRLGGVCVGACDSDEQMRLTFLSTFGCAFAV